jgi:ankyrin repeat protein
MSCRWSWLLLLCFLLTFAHSTRAQPDGLMLTNEIRITRGRLQFEQRNLSPRQLDELAYTLGRSNYLARAIEQAVMGNQFSRAEKLLQEFPGTIDDIEPFYGIGSLLYRAVQGGPDERLTFLLAHKADPNRPSRQGEPPLIVAMRYQRWAAALQLLEAGAKATVTNAQGQSALEMLFQNWWGMQPATDPHLEVLTVLLKNGADPFTPAHDREQSSVIEFALRRPNYQSEQPYDLLLTNRPNPQQRTPSGQTALHLAALYGRTNALQFLLSAGFSPDLTNGLGLTPLQLLTDSTPPPSTNVALRRFPTAVMQQWNVARPRSALTPTPEAVAEFLLSRGATLDLFSAAGLGRTNELAAMLTATPSAANARDGYGRTPLHYAVSSLRLDSVKLLLRSGASPAAPTTKPVLQRGQEPSLPSGLTPLHLAVRRHNLELVHLLLQAGAPASPADQVGETPLHIAARSYPTNIVRLLLAAHATLDVTNRTSESPLDLAAASGSGENLELLLKAGANPAFGLGSNTLVHIAASHGNVGGLKVLLGRGFPVDARDTEGRTPLECALMARSWEVMNLLRSKGANLNAQDLHGYAPLHLTATLQDDEVGHSVEQSLWMKWKQEWMTGGGLRQQTLSKFIQWKLVSPPAPPSWTNTSLTAWLLQHGAQPNLTNRAGQTPLHVLCGQQWLYYSDTRATNRIASLLQAGAQVTLPDAGGLSCLHVAATNASGKILALLARQMPQNAKLRDAQGRTPLHYAAHSLNNGNDDHGARLEALLAAGLAPDTPDNQGRTALHEAVASYGYQGWRRTEMLLTLLTNRANPNVQDAEGFTPLHTAMQEFAKESNYGALEVWQLLLSNRAQVNLPDRQGRTPLHLLASMTGFQAHVGDHFADLLFTYPWDFAARDRSGQTPVHLWCANLDPGFDFNARLLATILTNKALVTLTNGAGDTPLHVAIRAGRQFTVPILLRAGANPAQRNARGESAYFLAVQKWDPNYGQIDERLRPAGVNTTFFNALMQPDRQAFDRWIEVDPRLCSVTNANGQTPLLLATERNQTEMAERLLELGAPLDLLSALRLDYMNDFQKLLAQHHGPIPSAWLFEAVHLRRVAAAQALVAAGGDLHATDAQGHSLAYRAKATRQPELEAWLREKGSTNTLFDAVGLDDRGLLQQFLTADPANVNRANAQAHTPLLLALEADKEELATFLLEHGADPKSHPPAGWTALHLAVAQNLVGVGQLLLRGGADPNAIASMGIGPLHLAAGLGRTEFAELLLTNGADVNLCPPADGGAFRNTPLHWAAHRGQPELVKLLLAHGADPKAPNGSGATPADLIDPIRGRMSLWMPMPPGIPFRPPPRISEEERREILNLLKEAEARAGSSPPAPKRPS